MRMQPGQMLDQYEIIEQIGAGAYAEVYKARDTKTGKTVMLKCPNPLLFADPKLYQRFMREAEIARHLDHPLVQHSLDLGHNRSEPYMVSFTSDGAWLYPSTYNAVNVFCLVLAIACFGLTAVTRRAV